MGLRRRVPYTGEPRGYGGAMRFYFDAVRKRQPLSLAFGDPASKVAAATRFGYK